MAIIDKAGACVVLAGVLLLGGSAHAKTAALKCQEAKLKAQGKLELCLKKNRAKVLGGKPDASAACQTKFSAALTKAGTACRYLDNGDGTVSDLNTGLQWEQKDYQDGSVNLADPHDADNGYTWADAMSQFLSLVNGDSSDGMTQTGLGGHSDWRLPTIEELAGIVDATQGNCGGGSGPCIDSTFGPTQAFYYWSATTGAGFPGYAWSVFFNGGSVGNFNQASGYYVRAVRGGF